VAYFFVTLYIGEFFVNSVGKLLTLLPVWKSILCWLVQLLRHYRNNCQCHANFQFILITRNFVMAGTNYRTSASCWHRYRVIYRRD